MPQKPYFSLFFSIALFFLFSSAALTEEDGFYIDLGLSAIHYDTGKVPEGWKLRRRFGLYMAGEARWIMDDGTRAVRLQSKAALTFLEKKVDINIKEFPVVTWRWKVENILQDIDEETVAGDDHPIRIFFAFEPDTSKQSFWFRLKRFIYLDRIHGHPEGGRYTEYLWSSHLKPGYIINDPGNPMQKLMVIEGGGVNLGKWLSYRRNLYDDYKKLYGEEPRHLIFVGIINDTDQTGQEATSYISDLMFHKK